MDGMPAIGNMIDTVPAMYPPVVTAYLFQSKHIAIGYASVGIVFVIMTVVAGVLSTRKSFSDMSRSFLNFLMVCAFFLATAMLVVSVYKSTYYFTAVKDPVGAFELEKGPLGQQYLMPTVLKR